MRGSKDSLFFYCAGWTTTVYPEPEPAQQKNSIFKNERKLFWIRLQKKTIFKNGDLL